LPIETETRPDTFETETRKNGSQDSTTGSDIDVYCICYREYYFSHCMLGSDGVSRFGLGLDETSHFSSLSLEGLRSCLGLDHKYIRLRLWVLQKYCLVKLLLINVFLVCCICK